MRTREIFRNFASHFGVSSSDKSDKSDKSDQSDQSEKSEKSNLITINPTMSTPFLKQRGGYRKLKVYRVAEIIYDITYHFTAHYLNKGDRTIDQMVQAARSGKQNIAEGSEASTTSRETEIKLTNVAKASLEELLIDYEDYLRVRQLEQWTPQHPRYSAMRQYASGEKINNEYAVVITRLNDEEIANLCITLINQATYMLRNLIARQQEQFITEGGIREQMTKARLEYRNKNK